MKSLGKELHLDGTIVSPSQRVAIINQQACNEGDEITINQIKYQLRLVAEKHVILTHESQRIALQLSENNSGLAQ